MDFGVFNYILGSLVSNEFHKKKKYKRQNILIWKRKTFEGKVEWGKEKGIVG